MNTIKDKIRILQMNSFIPLQNNEHMENQKHRMMKIRKELMHIGINEFPVNLMYFRCPYTTGIEIHEWLLLAEEVWNLNIENKYITDHFEGLLNKEINS